MWISLVTNEKPGAMTNTPEHPEKGPGHRPAGSWRRGRHPPDDAEEGRPGQRRAPGQPNQRCGGSGGHPVVRGRRGDVARRRSRARSPTTT
jgi:hypothetical protein